ncbi:DNA-binding response regulator [Cohnella thailandensis]|uniref:DNA-binding response regulator n=1 Tax=Cohnella thailandensis TaxID=557557 RepID=A0A841T0Z4_9BACL|nr:DNA-binding response regulator [Cohnella thailandensis]MBB6636068.1 DNA-binding response regulator [Cohnella thailandensis]MBP1976777.1 very-short-patch-repair endonuclease [Cohnella thailandensis]
MEARRVKERRLDDRDFKFDPAFEREYRQMMAEAIKSSRGERKRRLQEEHGIAEKILAYVWWLAMGSLKHLHPEYEIIDLRGGTRFADYAYLPSRTFGLLLEVDGFGPHWREISRWKFDDNEERQNLLLIDEWKLLRFSYDGLNEKTARCQQTILMAMARWGRAVGVEQVELNVYERAILHYAMTADELKLTAKLVALKLQINRRTALQYMDSLANKGLLTPIVSQSGRKMAYELVSKKQFLGRR